MNHGKSLRLVLLAYPGMNLLDLSGPLQAFLTAGRCAASAGLSEPEPLYEVRVLSVQGGSLSTGAGLTVITEPLHAVESRLPVDTLIAPGGSVGEVFEADPLLVPWIGDNAARVRRVCSVCTGANEMVPLTL